MESWQGIYLIAVALSFVIGWYFTPILAVIFIWIIIISMESTHYWRGLRIFEEEVEEAEEEREERE